MSLVVLRGGTPFVPGTAWSVQEVEIQANRDIYMHPFVFVDGCVLCANFHTPTKQPPFLH